MPKSPKLPCKKFNSRGCQRPASTAWVWAMKFFCFFCLRCLPEPQVNTEQSLLTAALWKGPHRITMTSSPRRALTCRKIMAQHHHYLFTVRGDIKSSFVPCPNCPAPLPPQEKTSRLPERQIKTYRFTSQRDTLWSATVCRWPHATSTRFLPWSASTCPCQHPC